MQARLVRAHLEDRSMWKAVLAGTAALAVLLPLVGVVRPANARSAVRMLAFDCPHAVVSDGSTRRAFVTTCAGQGAGAVAQPAGWKLRPSCQRRDPEPEGGCTHFG